MSDIDRTELKFLDPIKEKEISKSIFHKLFDCYMEYVSTGVLVNDSMVDTLVSIMENNPKIQLGPRKKESVLGLRTLLPSQKVDSLRAVLKSEITALKSYTYLDVVHAFVNHECIARDVERIIKANFGKEVELIYISEDESATNNNVTKSLLNLQTESHKSFQTEKNVKSVSEFCRRNKKKLCWGCGGLIILAFVAIAAIIYFYPKLSLKERGENNETTIEIPTTENPTTAQENLLSNYSVTLDDESESKEIIISTSEKPIKSSKDRLYDISCDSIEVCGFLLTKKKKYRVIINLNNTYIWSANETLLNGGKVRELTIAGYFLPDKITHTLAQTSNIHELVMENSFNQLCSESRRFPLSLFNLTKVELKNLRRIYFINFQDCMELISLIANSFIFKHLKLVVLDGGVYQERDLTEFQRFLNSNWNTTAELIVKNSTTINTKRVLKISDNLRSNFSKMHTIIFEPNSSSGLSLGEHFCSVFTNIRTLVIQSWNSTLRPIINVASSCKSLRFLNLKYFMQNDSQHHQIVSLVQKQLKHLEVVLDLTYNECYDLGVSEQISYGTLQVFSKCYYINPPFPFHLKSNGKDDEVPIIPF